MNRRANHQHVYLILSGASLVAGCALPAKLTVQQPGISGSQRGMQLSSEWAHFARGQGQGARVLLAFGLPGARRGDKQYFVYMQFSSDAVEHVLDAQHPSGVSGFFEQVHGRYAGITQFESAKFHVQLDDHRCRGEISAVCKDGTGLQGRFDARRDDWVVEQFESEFEPRGADH